MLDQFPLRRFQTLIHLKEDLLVEHLLAAEIFVNHPLVDDGGSGDLIHPRAVKALFGKMLLRGPEDVLPGFFGVPFPPGHHEGFSQLPLARIP